jgi:predicted dehydrogenase
VGARFVQTPPARAHRLLRKDPLCTDRRRLLGIRGRFAAAATALMDRVKEGGGIIFDMMPHYHYMLEQIVAPVERLVCLGANYIKRRWDEAGQPYRADADDACYGILQLMDGIIAQIMCSWCVRVRRDDIGIMAIDGIGGSAVAGFNYCWIQPRMATPMAQMESRCGEAGRFLHRLAAPAGDQTLRQRIPSPMGAILAPRRRRLTIPVESAGRRRWRAARGAVVAELARTQVD